MSKSYMHSVANHIHPVDMDCQIVEELQTKLGDIWSMAEMTVKKKATKLIASNIKTSDILYNVRTLLMEKRILNKSNANHSKCP
jgi:citrate synthase